MQNHGVFLNVKTMGTPFQMYFPDNLLYVYKRITTSGSWGSWEKMNARSWDDIQSKPTIPTDTNQLTNGAGYITSSGSCNYANSAGSAGAVSTSVAAGSTKNLVYADMASNDQCRIMCGGADNAGYMEIATADDGNEPIYVRQYTGVFGSITRTLTLLDGSGNTVLPGRISLQGSYQVYVG